MTPRLSDAEPVTPATMQAAPGYTCEAEWLRHARAHLRDLLPYLPRQPGYSKRPRKAAGLLRSVNRILATTTSVWSDDVGVCGLHPGRTRPLPRYRQTLRPDDATGQTVLRSLIAYDH
jgi:hypothetical protein